MCKFFIQALTEIQNVRYEHDESTLQSFVGSKYCSEFFFEYHA